VRAWRTLAATVGRTPSLRRLSAIRPLILLALSPGSLVRVATSLPVRQGFPGLVSGARLVLALYAGALLALVAWAPGALLPVASVGVLVWLALIWRARPAYGRRRGLAPGSLAIMPLRSLVDLWFYREAATRHGPVFKVSNLGRPMVCVVGLDRGTALLRTAGDRLLSIPFPFNRFVPGGFLRHMTSEPHARYRAILRTAIAPGVVDDCEPAIAACVATGLGRLAAASARAGAAGVSCLPYLEDLVYRAFTRLFFGIEPESDDAERLRALYPVIDFRNPTGASPRTIEATLEEITEVVRRQRRRAQMPAAPGEPPCRAFLFELERELPEALDDVTVVRNLIYILHTGANDVIGLLHWVLKLLSENPSWARRLCDASPAGSDGTESLASRIVSECLRLEQSENVNRAAHADVHFAGFLIPKGWLVRVCVRESHRDPAVFPDPDRFDPDRFLGRRYARAEYSPFGLPPRPCLGDHVTRSVASLFVTELATYDCSVMSDGPRAFSGFRHWAPSPAFRVKLVRRAELDPVR
jgi:cytochrome P450